MGKRKQGRKKRSQAFDELAHIRGLSRATLGSVPKSRAHTTKKGKRGYDRKAEKRTFRNQGGDHVLHRTKGNPRFPFCFKTKCHPFDRLRVTSL